MPITKFLQKTNKHEILTYRKPKDPLKLKKTHVPYSGSPQKHPYDPDKIILIPDPYSSNAFYYEFKANDISLVEELVNIVDQDGETVHMVRVWVKKRSVAVLCSPFLVDDTTK